MSPNADRARMCVIASYVIGLGLFFAPYVVGMPLGESEGAWLAVILVSTFVLNVLAIRYGKGVAPGSVFFAWFGIFGDVALAAIWVIGSGLAVR